MADNRPVDACHWALGNAKHRRARHFGSSARLPRGWSLVPPGCDKVRIAPVGLSLFMGHKARRTPPSPPQPPRLAEAICE
jgi:hypothetical protein